MSEIIIYTTQDNKTKISLKVEGDTVWLNQNQLAELFDSSKSSISEHIKNILESNELNETSVVKEYLTTAFSWCWAQRPNITMKFKDLILQGKSVVRIFRISGYCKRLYFNK